MNFDAAIEGLGEANFLSLGGLLIGIAFGFLAQRSRFCLRASTLEVGRGRLGDRLSIWLISFSIALMTTQGLILAGLFDTGAVRQLNNPGSLSGAILGGLMFGCGMVLTRACASRMLVLSATGNLRALLSGLVFAVMAQAALKGILSPARQWINELWMIDGHTRDVIAATGIGHGGALAFGALWLVAGVALVLRNRVRPLHALFGAGVGLTVGAAWWFTFQTAAAAFDPVNVQALSFTGPSADVLMAVLSPPGTKLTFDLGLIPGVVIGAFLGGWIGRDLKLEGFQDGASMRRYIAGGCLMGFGSVLAGGCAVGAGVSGASIFTLTAWLVLWSMWIGAVLTDRLIDRAPDHNPSAGEAIAAPPAPGV